MPIKEKCFAPAQTKQNFGNVPNISLTGNFIIGKINTQEAADDQMMKLCIGQTGHAGLRKAIKMDQPAGQLFMAFIIEAKI